MTQRKRLAVARFWYEGNAFCLQPAGREDFERREWQRGQAGLDAARGKATELAAVADFQDSRSDWEVRASRCASAQPAGPVPQPFFQAYVDEVLDDLRGQHWDAIYLSLHGACITDADDSPELSLLRAIRAEHPRVPIGASFDLHANIPPALPPLLSCSASYRTYPHIDMRETAARCLERLIAIAEGGIRPVAAFRNGGAWLQSANMRTDAGPMADLQALARARTVGPLRDIALHGGFPMPIHRTAARRYGSGRTPARRRRGRWMRSMRPMRRASPTSSPSSSRRPTASAWPCGRRAWWR